MSLGPGRPPMEAAACRRHPQITSAQLCSQCTSRLQISACPDIQTDREAWLLLSAMQLTSRSFLAEGSKDAWHLHLGATSRSGKQACASHVSGSGARARNALGEQAARSLINSKSWREVAEEAVHKTGLWVTLGDCFIFSSVFMLEL